MIRLLLCLKVYGDWIYDGEKNCGERLECFSYRREYLM